MLNYEKLLRSVEKDMKQVGKNEKQQVITKYEIEQDNYDALGLAKAQEQDDYYEPMDDDDIDLDEAEIQAYINLKKAHKLIGDKENPNELASILLRSSKRINKPDEIKDKCAGIQLSKHLPWIHTLTLHSFKPLDVANHEDEIERELAFYNQALLSANEAITRLTSQNIPCIRPEDYFAEMVKSDDHMLKIRDKLLYSKKVIEMRESRRKAREQKKLGKKVQVAKLQKQLEDKKAHMEALKLYKKKHGSKEFNMDDYEKDVEALKSGGSSSRSKPARSAAPARGGKGGRGARGASGPKGSRGSAPGRGAGSAPGRGAPSARGGKGGGPKGVQKPQKRMGKNKRQQSRNHLKSK